MLVRGQRIGGPRRAARGTGARRQGRTPRMCHDGGRWGHVGHRWPRSVSGSRPGEHELHVSLTSGTPNSACASILCNDIPPSRTGGALRPEVALRPQADARVAGVACELRAQASASSPRRSCRAPPARAGTAAAWPRAPTHAQRTRTRRARRRARRSSSDRTRDRMRRRSRRRCPRRGPRSADPSRIRPRTAPWRSTIQPQSPGCGAQHRAGRRRRRVERARSCASLRRRHRVASARAAAAAQRSPRGTRGRRR